jgi:hypothetical protein
VSLRSVRDTGAYRSFSRGFHQRHPLVLVAAAVMLAVAVLGLEIVVRAGGITAVPEGRFVRFRNDDSGHLGYLMARLRKAPSNGDAVYLLGGSATMESFLNERSLGADVSRSAGRHVEVISLAGHAESLGGSLALVENLPSGGGVLAVGLSPARFASSPQDDTGLLYGYPYLLRSARMRRILSRTPVRLPPADVLFPGAVKYAVTYLEERARTRLAPFSDIGYSKHYTIDGPLYPTSQKLKWARQDVARDVAGYASYAAYNFAVLEALVRLARERGFDVVFFDQPLNPDVIGPTWNGLVPDYRRRALALAARLDVPYLRVGQIVHLDNTDFLDDYHLVVKGRLKWQPVFSQELGAALARDRIDAGTL